MAYGGTGRTQRPEPSWPTVIATTVRLWLERHPGAGRRSVLTLALVAVLGAGAGGVLIGHAATSSARPGGAGQASARPAVPKPGSASSGPASVLALQAAATTRQQAAQWIAGQVAPSAIVSCDPAMCAALQAAGVPGGRLLSIGTAAADPLGSDVVVATPALRSEFGTRLQDVYAPAVIASFGSGAGRIDIRAIAPDGAAAFESALAADRRARVAAGRQLLGNRRVVTTAGARSALMNGDVDSRLLLTLAALAAQRPVRILAFGDASPGAGPAVPLRSAEIVPLGAGGRGAVLSFLDAQRPPFLPLRAAVAGPTALTVEYAAPSPLGLLGGQLGPVQSRRGDS
jgi:hypothetical protein